MKTKRNKRKRQKKDNAQKDLDLSGFLPSTLKNVKTAEKKKNEGKSWQLQQDIAAAVKAAALGTPGRPAKVEKLTWTQKKAVRSGTIAYNVHTVAVEDYILKPISRIACDYARNRVAVSREDGSIEIWSFHNQTWFQLTTSYAAPDTSVEALIWRDDILFSAGLDGFLMQYCPLTFERELIPSHTSAIWCLALNPAQNYLAAGSEEGNVVLFEWNGSNSFEYQGHFQNQLDRLLSIDWHISGEVLVTGGINTIQLWNVKSRSVDLSISVPNSIVWSVKILKDMTIVSGDSRGVLSFWSGRIGTQIQRFHCHDTDIFSLYVVPEEDRIFAAGVNPSMLECFRLPDNNDPHSFTDWTLSVQRFATHSHDVRALGFLDEYLISAGLDGALHATIPDEALIVDPVCSPLMPSLSPISISKDARLVLMQYPKRLALWKLATPEETKQLDDQEVQHLTAPLRNILEIKPHRSEHIVTSVISPNGQWIAYATRLSVRIFYIKNVCVGFMTSATRVTSIPDKISESAVKCMQFISNDLILGCVDGTVKCVQLSVDGRPSVRNYLEPSPSSHPFYVKPGPVSRLAVCLSTSRIAVADTSQNIIIYRLQHTDDAKMVVQHVLRPEDDPNGPGTPISALAFSPDGMKLALAYAQCRNDSLIAEIDLPDDSENKPSFVRGSKYIDKDFSLRVETPVITLKYSQFDHSLIIVQDRSHVRFYNTLLNKLSFKENLSQSDQQIVHFEEFDERSALAVQVRQSSRKKQLPKQVLKKRKFGVN